MNYQDRIEMLVELLGSTEEALWDQFCNQPKSEQRIAEAYGKNVPCCLADGQWVENGDDEMAFELWLRAMAHTETGLILTPIADLYPHLFEDAEAVEE